MKSFHKWEEMKTRKFPKSEFVFRTGASFDRRCLQNPPLEVWQLCRGALGLIMVSLWGQGLNSKSTEDLSLFTSQ